MDKQKRNHLLKSEFNLFKEFKKFISKLFKYRTNRLTFRFNDNTYKLFEDLLKKSKLSASYGYSFDKNYSVKYEVSDNFWLELDYAQNNIQKQYFEILQDPLVKNFKIDW